MVGEIKCVFTLQGLLRMPQVLSEHEKTKEHEKSQRAKQYACCVLGFHLTCNKALQINGLFIQVIPVSDFTTTTVSLLCLS